ncbi:MAG: hypothetical protein HRU14_01525 [Planctomycetes bacterium]|nr:hypothetical protein [Planctomycetota bacterium]
MPANNDTSEQGELFGHPTGLFTLFFAEMWERFSYYGMRALLIFYMIKGFLGYGDGRAYEVYGAYTALVYMTPFIGGMLADRVLGKRLAVVIGGVLMAAGHLMMTQESEWPFFFALALLICGNGFFKPNISTIVGTLYRSGSGRRDDGFNIFYMGINLGAAMSPLLCGYVGETYGWHYGFGLATIGMMVGLAVFVMPTLLTQALIMGAAVASAISMVVFRPDNAWAIGINAFVALSLVAAAVIACTALYRGGLPKWAGARPETAPRGKDWMVYAGIAVSIPVFAMLVSGFSPFRTAADPDQKSAAERTVERVTFLEEFGVDPGLVQKVAADPLPVQRARGDAWTFVDKAAIFEIKTGVKKDTYDRIESLGPKKETLEAIESGSQDEETFEDLERVGVNKSDTDEVRDGGGGLRQILGILVSEISKPAGLVLTVLGLLAFGYLFWATFGLAKTARERMLAALILIFFQMLFFAFFEQAGSSVNNFTDRNVDRVAQDSVVTDSMVGETIRLQPTQEQLGYSRGEKLFTMTDLDQLRESLKPHDIDFEISWTISESDVGMGYTDRVDELPASIFQSINPTYIIIFALLFNLLWAFLRKKGLEPNAGVKFSFGLMQLGLGFGAFWMGAQGADGRGMVTLSWLLLGYLLQTTGELCLSPVGLSVMTKMAPKVLVSTLMGAWFLATAFSQYLAAIISQLTGVGEGGGDASLPAPIDTVNVYGDVFGQIAIAALIAGGCCLLLSPLLKKWMHEGE